MKKNKLALYLILLTRSVTVYAQDYVFKVLANKGTNEHKSGDTWQPLKTGASLNKSDEIKLSNNAYIGMVSASGKPVEIKDPGTHKISEIAKKLDQGSSVINKYTDFILSSNSAEGKKNRLSATGAVHRGDSFEALKLLLPENQHASVYNNKVSIIWEAPKELGPYIVTIRNMFDDEIEQVETTEAHYTVDFTQPKFANENAILIDVKSKANGKQTSKQHLIKKLASKDYATITTSLTEIENEIKEPTAINYLLLASFYESNKLYIDAISAYDKVLEIAPDVPEYIEAFDQFLLRRVINK